LQDVIYISGIDALDRTPLLDTQFYSGDLSAKTDANEGWGNEE
jgi:tRNA (Thr-GGU) A37 N-methylase